MNKQPSKQLTTFDDPRCTCNGMTYRSGSQHSKGTWGKPPCPLHVEWEQRGGFYQNHQEASHQQTTTGQS